MVSSQSSCLCAGGVCAPGPTRAMKAVVLPLESSASTRNWTSMPGDWINAFDALATVGSSRTGKDTVPVPAAVVKCLYHEIDDGRGCPSADRCARSATGRGGAPAGPARGERSRLHGPGAGTPGGTAVSRPERSPAFGTRRRGRHHEASHELLARPTRTLG